MKTVVNKTSDYLDKNELTPLADPQKEFKAIMTELKSQDWKVQF